MLKKVSKIYFYLALFCLVLELFLIVVFLIKNYQRNLISQKQALTEQKPTGATSVFAPVSSTTDTSGVDSYPQYDLNSGLMEVTLLVVSDSSLRVKSDSPNETISDLNLSKDFIFKCFDSTTIYGSPTDDSEQVVGTSDVLIQYGISNADKDEYIADGLSLSYAARLEKVKQYGLNQVITIGLSGGNNPVVDRVYVYVEDSSVCEN